MVPYQDAPAPPMTEELREQCARVLHVLTADGRTLKADDAVIHIYEQLGYGAASILRWPPFSWLTGPGYRLVASNRRTFAKLTFRTPE